ncbi:TatD family hydrolase [Rhabdochromatium marinum]|uniref:TatD family hydrolase n=1 Tax=Rhabdochromatium marinum TaxID=48729 RepID=UPI001905CDFB|nr:DNAase [Rhabdochromatium marinum]
MIDTHCHLDFPAFDADRSAVLHRAHAQGVVALVIPGVSAANWPAVLDLQAQAPERLFPALGLHPVFIDHHQPADLDTLRANLQRQRPVALGEIGLDFALADTDRAAQQWYFTQQLELAAEFNLPVLLHVRKAHDSVLAALRAVSHPNGIPGGIAHAFNGSLQQARQYLELGFKLGFGGMLTYTRSRKLRQLARELPLDALVLETDAPDMTVASHQYQRNSPEYLPEVLTALAEVRGQAPELLAQTTTANACHLLRLPIPSPSHD